MSVPGGHMGNPNPLRQAYLCQTCGEPRPPYQFYCDKHLKDGERYDRPLLIDRFMRRLLGRSKDNTQEPTSVESTPRIAQDDT
jgi:hypothetical protein